MQKQGIVAFVIGILIVLFPAAFIWYINVGGIYAAIKNRKRAKMLEKAVPNLTCYIDADCPLGFVCVEGRCISQTV